ncbi:MAG: ribose 5-phosphate isomerase B [Clostridia bacterium]|nr:ribose 5-phosphate isomerase B [Clostridia bacterium]
MMKIAIGNDHGAVELKQHLVKYLEGRGCEVVNFGTDTTDSTDYPIYAARVAKAVVSGDCDKGVLICGTGLGISMAANKIKGVRCAVCTEPVSTRLARQHNDANIVALGARIIGNVMAEAIVDAFLTTEFEGGRHQRRVDMIMALGEGKAVE